jgi:hypothetical protein
MPSIAEKFVPDFCTSSIWSQSLYQNQTISEEEQFMSREHLIYGERPAEPDEYPQKPERPEIAPPEIPGIEPRPDSPEINPS